MDAKEIGDLIIDLQAEREALLSSRLREKNKIMDVYRKQYEDHIRGCKGDKTIIEEAKKVRAEGYKVAYEKTKDLVEQAENISLRIRDIMANQRHIMLKGR